MKTVQTRRCFASQKKGWALQKRLSGYMANEYWHNQCSSDVQGCMCAPCWQLTVGLQQQLLWCPSAACCGQLPLSPVVSGVQGLVTCWPHGGQWSTSGAVSHSQSNRHHTWSHTNDTIRILIVLELYICSD